MKFELISIDGLDRDELFVGANKFAELARTAAKTTLIQACQSGAMLNKLKDETPHGEWTALLKTRFDYSHQTAVTYMHLASNFKRLNFEALNSIRDAVKYLDSDQKEKETPREERKTGRVEVVKPEAEPHGQQSVQPDENAVPPEPKTNTKHSKETAKANEADRPAPMEVTPEIVEESQENTFVRAIDFEEVEEKTLSDFGLDEIFEFIESVAAQDAKVFAKKLRKLADNLDPPTKFVKPTVDDVASYCAERNNKIDPEAFVAHYSANGWKLRNGNKMADWKSAVITWEKHNGSGNGRAQTAGSGRGKPHTDF